MMLLSILLFVGPPTISLVYGLCVWITYALSYEFPWVSEEAGKLLIPSSLVLTVAIASTCMGMKLLLETKTTTVNDGDNDDYSLIIYNIKNLLIVIAYWAGSAECIYRIRKQVVVGIDSIPFYGKDHLKGKTILITGANAGIGKETAFQLASMGAKRIVLLCRSQSRAEAAIAELVARGTNASSSSSSSPVSIKKEQFSICPCDLSDFQSIRNAVDYMTTQLKIDNVHVLINNAGLILGTHTKSKKDGYEMMMQANHLGHFLLTNLLLDRNILLKEGSRIVNLTSALFQFAINNNENAGFDFEDMFCENGHRKYTMFGQYSQTKLANILFTKELVRRYPKIVSYAVHPGIVETNIASNMNWYLRIPAKMFAWFVYSLRKTSVQGAYGSVYCAAAPLEELPPSNSSNGDGYYYWIQNCTLRHVQMTTTAADDAKRLWTISEQLTGNINNDDK